MIDAWRSCCSTTCRVRSYKEESYAGSTESLREGTILLFGNVNCRLSSWRFRWMRQGNNITVFSKLTITVLNKRKWLSSNVISNN